MIIVDPSSTRELRRLRRQMRRMSGQVPFATSRAINDTAFDARKHIVERVYPGAFTVRAKSFARAAFRVDPSSKRRLEARLYDRLDKAFLRLQAEGGTKRPQGRYIAIAPRRERTTTGKGKVTGKRSFVLESNGDVLVVRREGRGEGAPLRVLRWLVPQARVQKRFMFFEEGGRVVAQRWPENFERRWRQAMRSA